MLTSGQLLAERYRLRHRIAVGGMGEVWQSVDVRLDRTVAVKVLKPELCGDAEFLHRFRTEARTTAALNHPGIAAVHDYGETSATVDGPEDTAYLVMELVEGEPLAAILARNGRVNTEHTLDMLEQAGRALHAAHERGLVHRDVKPGNILITADGTVKLTDFGIAKAAHAAPVTRSGMVMGTAHYIAPEQALGGDATPASDVYSLAVVGYECLMGHRPFLSDNAVTVAMMHIRDLPPPLPPDVPNGVRGLVEATLVKDPRRRYGDGGEFANAVASTRAGAPLPTPAALSTALQSGTALPPVAAQPPGQPMPQPGVGQPGAEQLPPGQLQPGQLQPGQPAQGALPVHAYAEAPQQLPPGSGNVAPVPPGAGAQHQPPPGGTYPPGVIPPQPAVPTGFTAHHPSVVGMAGNQPPGGPPAARPRQNTNRAVLVVVLVFGALVLLVIGVLMYWSLRDPGSPRHAAQVANVYETGMTHTDLDSAARLGHTAQRNSPASELLRTGQHGPSTGAPLNRHMRNEVGGIADTAEVTSGEQPDGHDEPAR